MKLFSDDASAAGSETRRPIEHLRACAALKQIDEVCLQRMAEGGVLLSLPAGKILHEAGSPSDGIYLVTAGRVGVRTGGNDGWTAQIQGGELVGELSWLMHAPHSAQLVAIRDSELLWLPKPVLDEVAAASSAFSLAIGRLCAERLHRANRRVAPEFGARVLAIVPNSPDMDAIGFASQLVAELRRAGRTELVWDERASAHSSGWFDQIERNNAFVVYLADPVASRWTRQCCRQADVLLLVGDAHAAPREWPYTLGDLAARGDVPIALALLHGERFAHGAATRWLDASMAKAHHHIVDAPDVARLARLITHRGVGLVLSGGGARGFAHLGVIRALREAQIPIDFVGGSSIGAIIAAGAGLNWSDAEMRERYRRSFVDTNPVNDYTFPFVALTRGGKVSRLLRREFGEILIEDLRLPFFCVSTDLTSGHAVEHRRGSLWQALRASVAIPGVIPPVFAGDAVLVDGAAINNLPVDLMKSHSPGYVIGSDVGADHPFSADSPASEQPPLWPLLSRLRGGQRRINIFQILMRAGMVGGDLLAVAQRGMADVILKPPLDDIDLLNWQAFEEVILRGYDHARSTLRGLPQLPRSDGPGAIDERAQSVGR